MPSHLTGIWLKIDKYKTNIKYVHKYNIHIISKAIYYIFWCFLFRKNPLSISRDTAILL